jgi:hypothetical protein
MPYLVFDQDNGIEDYNIFNKDEWMFCFCVDFNTCFEKRWTYIYKLLFVLDDWIRVRVDYNHKQ